MEGVRMIGKNKFLCTLVCNLLFIPYSFSSPTANNKIHVVVYNVQNLFDTEHDEGKNDWGFTPKGITGKAVACKKISSSYYRKECFASDWNEHRYKVKLDQIKNALDYNTVTLPDVLGLVEVENIKVIKDLAQHLGYKNYFITESPDKRGVDVALLYNEKAGFINIGKEEYVIDNHKNFKFKPTRNILEVIFRVADQYNISIFVNHWPSQAAPGLIRTKAAEVAKKAYAKRLAIDKNHHILLTGDFNTIASDYPHPFNTVTLTAPNPLFAIRDLFFKSAKVNKMVKKKTPMGTYFYPKDMSWNQLDKFFIDKNLLDGKGLEAHLASYKIYTKKITKNFVYNRAGDYHYDSVISNVPLRYDHKADDINQAGFSDHFPISIELKF